MTKNVWLSLMAMALFALPALRADSVCEEGFVSLFNGTDLTGWSVKGGTATYEAVDGAIVGTCNPESKHNSFLCYDKEFGDFIFKCEFKVIVPGNSGIQFRSHIKDAEGVERVYGYQSEIDPTEAFDTCRIYDEGRRGHQHKQVWMNDVDPQWKADAQAAYKEGDWNEVEIQCIGTSIRTWLNGKPVSKFHDYYDLSGIFGLQIHAGAQGQVAWRNIRVKDLGKSEWKDFFVEKDGQWEVVNAYKFVPECWSFVEKDGKIVLQGHHEQKEPKDGLIVSYINYVNFAARVTYWMENGNSALYFRAEEVDTTWLLRGYQDEIANDDYDANIWHTAGAEGDPPGRGWIGYKTDGEAERAIVHEVRNSNTWNTTCAVAIGDELTTMINGYQVINMKDPIAEKRGKVGLQLHGGADSNIWFYDFQIIPYTQEQVDLINR